MKGTPPDADARENPQNQLGAIIETVKGAHLALFNRPCRRAKGEGQGAQGCVEREHQRVRGLFGKVKADPRRMCPECGGYYLLGEALNLLRDAKTTEDQLALESGDEA